MSRIRRLRVAACLAATGLAVTACTSSGAGSKPAPAGLAPTGTTSSAMAIAASSAGTAAGCTPTSALTVGVKVDQFGTGYLDVRNYEYEGLDVDVAKYISNALFNVADPYFLPVSSSTRESALSSCAVRFFAATYTILPSREKEFDLAGPYLVTRQGVMLGPHSPTINSLADLARKRVCVAGQGSQSENVLEEVVPDAVPVEVSSYSDCLNELRRGDVDAFSTDLAILYGYLTDPDNTGFRILRGITIGDPIFYGIAFRKSDHALCERAAQAIEKMISSKQWYSYIDADLPNYLQDEPLYPEGLQPSDQEIETSSCVTPSS